MKNTGQGHEGADFHVHDHGRDKGGYHRHHHDHHHGHDHEHVHEAGLLGRTRHTLSEVFGMHSHDTADQVDDTLEANTEGRRALFISLGVLALTALIQGIIVGISGSVALLGDTLHNVADALTAVPLLIAFRLGTRPATKRFTFGFGRAEDLGGVFVIAMITLSSAMAAYEAITRLIHPQTITHLWAVAAAAVVGFVGNEVVARYRIRVGQKIGSAALVADGLHARTDGFTSLAVLFGAAGVALGLREADPIIGLVITVAIIGVLRSAVKQVGGRLMDAIDPELFERANHLIVATPGVLQSEQLRMRWNGHNLTAIARVAVEATLSLQEAQRIATSVRTNLENGVRRLSDVTVELVEKRA